MNDKPLLIHIGFQRTMTTWLQKELFSYPNNDFQIVGGDTETDHKSRTTHIFSTLPPFENYATALHDLLDNGITAAYKNNKIPIISNEALCGNIFSGCRESKIIADSLKEAFPHAKIYIGIREQTDLIYSNWIRYITSGGYARPKEWIAEKHYKDLKYPLFTPQAYLFDSVVKYYQNLFGSENVLTQPIELFKKCPETYIENIHKLLDIKNQSHGPTHKLVNEGHDIAHIMITRHVNCALGHPLFKENRIKAKLRETLNKSSKILANFIPTRYKKEMKNTFKIEIDKTIGDYFRESNSNLEKLIKQDLQEYGFKTNKKLHKETEKTT